MATEAEILAAAEEAEKQGRSTIEFPYMNLTDAIAVAQGIRDTTGSGVCQHDQLAAALSLSPKSSGYRMRLSAARLFGLMESAAGGVKLTDLGHGVVDSARSRESRAKAFLKVPLFAKIYDNNRGKQLPPPAALEREMEALGVAPKQKERARQVFQRSAEVAGFFDMDRTRLIMPAGAGADTPPVEEKKDVSEKEKNGGGGPPTGLHPFIQGLLQTLPIPDTDWSMQDRVKWLQTAANIFDLIYKGEGGGIVVSAARADRSPRPGEH